MGAFGRQLAIWVLCAIAPIRSLAADAEPLIEPVGVRGFVKRTVARKLARFRIRGSAVGEAIFAESERHGLDPLLVLAVIEQESGFHPFRRGTHGELGMMQIKPRTARWLARRASMRWTGKSELFDPHQNVRYGTAYLAYLKKRFPKGTAYLAAYNAGPANVRRGRARDDYSLGVMKRYARIRRELAAF